MRLLRLGRVVRKLDRYLEYGAAMLILLLCFYMLVAHWLACVWYSIGRSDADSGLQYSWLWKLANVTQSPYSYVWSNESDGPELVNGPSRKTMYVTALYFTMTCMTSVGFGNVAAETDNEKIFTICMMIVAGAGTLLLLAGARGGPRAAPPPRPRRPRSCAGGRARSARLLSLCPVPRPPHTAFSFTFIEFCIINDYETLAAVIIIIAFAAF